MSAHLYIARVVARLMVPEREAAPLDAPSPEAFPALIEACRENKVPLLSLDESPPLFAPFYASSAYRSAKAKEQRRWASLRDEYLKVHKAFDEGGIDHVLIKSVGIAPSWPYTPDNVDLLVPLASGLRAREHLIELGYAEVKNVEEPHKFLFRTFHAGNPLSAIHLHEFVGWGTGFMEDAQVLARARPAPDDPEISIPCPEDGLLVTFAHAFYEDKDIKLGDLWKVLHLLRTGDLDWGEVYGQATRRGWAQGLAACVWLWSELECLLYGSHSFPPEVMERARREPPYNSRKYLERRLAQPQPTFPFKISFGFSKRHYYAKVRRDSALVTRDKVLHSLRHSLAGIKHRLPFKIQRPMLITLSGVDGSGKTAHADALRRAFEECEIDVRSVWSRGGSSRFAALATALAKLFMREPLSPDLVGDERRAQVARKSEWFRRPVLRQGWLYLVALELAMDYWARTSWPLLRGSVVVSDRYVYDALVEMAVLADRTQILASPPARLLLAVTSRPHRAYLLDLPPEKALLRKPEEPRQFVEGQAFLYHRMASSWGMRIISTEADFATVSDLLTREVLTSYYGDWRSFVDRVLLPASQTQRRG